MTTPAITLDQSQTLAPAAQNVDKKGALEGRSVVPCPSKRWLTDVQIKRIALVAITIFATAAFAALGSAFLLIPGAGLPLACLTAAVYGSLGAICGGTAIAFCWPKADYQTAKGAATIRNDLKTNGLNKLHEDYNFSDLAKYGYISKKTAEEMESIYVMQPRTFYHPDPQRMRDYLAAKAIFDSAQQHHRRYEVIEDAETKFHKLRCRPDFLL